jgi:hypothetical protein
MEVRPRAADPNNLTFRAPYLWAIVKISSRFLDTKSFIITCGYLYEAGAFDFTAPIKTAFIVKQIKKSSQDKFKVVL